MILTRFPLSPSVNEYLAPCNNRLIKTEKARAYDNIVYIYKLKNNRRLQEIRTILSECHRGDLIQVDMYFVFAHKRLIDKKGNYKTIDVSNRIKQAHDGLAKCLEIDDLYFKKGLFEAITCDNDKDEQIIIRLTPYKGIRKLSDINGSNKDQTHQTS